MIRYVDTMERICEAVNHSFGRDVKVRSRRFAAMQAKKAFVYITVTGGFSQAAVAEYMGCNRSSVYHLLHSAHDLMIVNRAFACAVKRIIKKLDDELEAVAV